MPCRIMPFCPKASYIIPSHPILFIASQPIWLDSIAFVYLSAIFFA